MDVAGVQISPLHPLWMVVLMVAMGLIPLTLAVTTSFIKISVVMSILKSGFGAQQLPGAVVVTALSIAITVFVMSPVIERCVEQVSAQPKFDWGAEGLKELPVRLETIGGPWREFLEKQAGEREKLALVTLVKNQGEKNQEDAASSPSMPNTLRILIPAFVLTELKEAFTIGFTILLPFLVIDLVVANILAGLGMFMVSPTLISLPLKILVFILVDGWILLLRGLTLSYQ